MEKSGSQKALKVISILMIVFGGLAIAFGLFGMVGGGVIGAAGVDAADDSAAALGGIAIVVGIGMLVSGVIDLVIGIFGLRGANNPQKIGVFFVFAIIGTVLAALGFVGTLMSGSGDASSIVSGFVGLLLPGACVILANNIKKENNL